MPATPPPSPGDPEFFEQLRNALRQFGFDTDGDLNDLVAAMQQQMTTMGAHGPMGMFSAADTEPDAAWRTTITAAKHALPEHGPDPRPTPARSLQIADACRMVDSWLNSHTVFATLGTEASAWTREEWIDASGAVWRRMVEPIITGSADALGEGIAPEAEEFGGLQAMFAPMMRTAASMMYRDQLKRTLAKLASTVLTGSEPGLQLFDKPQVVILPASVDTFTEGLDVGADEVLFYLAVRETARQRLFAGVSWLGPHLDTLIAHYAREIRIDLDFIGRQVNLESIEDLSLEKIAEVSQQVSGSFFEPATTSTQLEILGRLETLLALVEGWVDEVTLRATKQWLPGAQGLAEVLRRRRAAGGPEQALWQSLVGLEVRPRRIRDAANLWAALTNDRGAEARDAVWGHPDMVPASEDLDDPLRFVSGESAREDYSALDAELEKLLRAEREDG